jgi:acyl carrier protein
MNDTTSRLIQCFRSVFPDLPETGIPTATQDGVLTWDSVASITLINVVEDEFAITMDLERIAEFASFDAILSYVQEQQQGK